MAAAPTITIATAAIHQMDGRRGRSGFWAPADPRPARDAPAIAARRWARERCVGLCDSFVTPLKNPAW
jgi:hypothetical protein